MRLDQKGVVWLVVGFLLGVTVAMGGMTLRNRVQPAAIAILPPPTLVPTATPGPLRVFVNGHVRYEGVYSLPPQSRVEVAITAAGGFETTANTAVVNLAQPLADGMQIYVPGTDEEVPLQLVLNNPTASTGETTAAGAAEGALVNINRATVEELDILPGVGPSTAQKIVAHREEHGDFQTIEAIMDVSGIGDAKFNQMKDLITVGP